MQVIALGALCDLFPLQLNRHRYHEIEVVLLRLDRGGGPFSDSDRRDLVLLVMQDPLVISRYCEGVCCAPGLGITCP